MRDQRISIRDELLEIIIQRRRRDKGPLARKLVFRNAHSVYTRRIKLTEL